MTLKTQTSQVFNLTILYSAAKRERELNANLDRMMRNKLVQANEDEDSKEKYELVPSVRDLCKTLDGFVYVVDASSQSPAGACFLFLTLNAPIATKVVCFSRLLKCLRSLYGKQCGPRSDCSYRSSLFWVHPVCFYNLFVSNVRQLFAADNFSRRHFQMHFFLGALKG